jgi:hypothetical protein
MASTDSCQRVEANLAAQQAHPGDEHRAHEQVLRHRDRADQHHERNRDDERHHDGDHSDAIQEPANDETAQCAAPWINDPAMTACASGTPFALSTVGSQLVRK